MTSTSDKTDASGTEWRGTLACYPLASVFALLGASVLELGFGRAPLDGFALLALTSLCVVFGLLHGWAWQLSWRLLVARPRALQLTLVWLFALGAGAALCLRLGAFTRLFGPYRMLAIQTLAAAAVSVGALGAVTAWMQPTLTHPNGRLMASPPRVRNGAGGLLLMAAGFAFYSDRLLYPGLYPSAHEALRWSCYWGAMFALVLLVAEPLHRVTTRSRVLLPALFGVALVALPALSATRPMAFSALLLRPWSATLLHAAQRGLDFDGDGFPALLGGHDCAQFDASVHPGAREIPGNGIDDNCVLGDAKPSHLQVVPPAPATGHSPFDVVFITIDTLRPDHLGVYEPVRYGPHGRPTTPNLDVWAQQAVVFDHAYTPGAWTSIAIASIMRGVYPRRLHWTRYLETTQLRLLRAGPASRLPPGEFPRQVFPLAFEDPHPTLAGLFKRRGMHTAAIVHDGFSRMLSRGIGLEHDFDSYLEVETWERNRQDDSGVVALASRELARSSKQQGLFMWVHFFGPHSPNEVHPGTMSFGSSLVDGYDHEIRYLDEQLPALWRAIAVRGVPTIIVITGDHGEMFAPPARMHGFEIGDEDIRVPLLIRVPGWQPKRVEQLVSTIDLFPTLLALTDTPAPTDIDGLDLARWAHGNAPLQARTLFSETWRYEYDGQPIIDLIAAFDGKRKIVLDNVDYSFRGYDQSELRSPATWIDPTLPDPLTQSLLRYVEATGGALAPTD